MTIALPTTTQETLDWSWANWQPAFQELLQTPIDPTNTADWLDSWTQLIYLVYETSARLSVATTIDTGDTLAEQRFRNFISNVLPEVMAADQQLKQKLLASGAEPEGFEIPLRNMRAEAALFREANLPLITEDRQLGNEYNKITGAQTVTWEGEELTLMQLGAVYQDADRAKREQAWRLGMERQLADREAINENWKKLFALRQQVAANAGYPDYRAFAWEGRQRFDYTPDDCLSFHEAIEAAVVPAAKRIYERRRQRLGLETLRPWDLEARHPDELPLRPFATSEEFTAKAEQILSKVDPELGAYFATMRRENLLDLESRKGKAPGGYCTGFPVAQRPFIFMNAVGLASDVRVLLHEAGHAFHFFESTPLRYSQQQNVPMEFAEVASMSMELLAAPYLREADGGYYSEADYVRARIEHLEGIVLFWPYMAVVDAFQHWAYTNPEQGANPAACDARWAELWARFMPGVDWSGLEAELETGWHRKLHIHRIPFYYVEYGLAQLGAVQVWNNALQNQSAAVESYRQALRLGGTATLPQLFEAAGARFAFDTATMQSAIDLIERTIEELGA